MVLDIIIWKQYLNSSNTIKQTAASYIEQAFDIRFDGELYIMSSQLNSRSALTYTFYQRSINRHLDQIWNAEPLTNCEHTENCEFQALPLPLHAKMHLENLGEERA